MLAIAWIVAGCGGSTEPGTVMAGDYELRFVDFHTSILQPAPAVSVSTLGDSTVVERGDLKLEVDGRGFLELVYRWRYGGIPSGETVLDTLLYVFHDRAPFRTPYDVDWFRLQRGPAHIAYLVRQPDGTVVLVDYDRAGTMDFYFQR